MSWRVAKVESVTRRIFLNGTEVTTGTMTVVYRLNDAGTLKYLQSGLTTVGTGVQTFPVTYVAGVGWHVSLLVPAIFTGFNITIETTHSNGIIQTEEHYVTVNDLDSITSISVGLTDGATVRGA